MSYYDPKNDEPFTPDEPTILDEGQQMTLTELQRDHLLSLELIYNSDERSVNYYTISPESNWTEVDAALASMPALAAP